MAKREWSVAIACGGSGSVTEVMAETAEEAKKLAVDGMGPGWDAVGEPWIESNE